jgi:hypothetical protein
MEGEATSAERDPLDIEFEELARKTPGGTHEFVLPIGNVRCAFRAPYLSEWERINNRLAEAKDRSVLFRELAGQLVLRPTRQEFNNAIELNFAFPPQLYKYFQDTMGGVAEGAAKKG